MSAAVNFDQSSSIVCGVCFYLINLELEQDNLGVKFRKVPFEIK